VVVSQGNVHLYAYKKGETRGRLNTILQHKTRNIK
jgi:hypothetical protein